MKHLLYVAIAALSAHAFCTAITPSETAHNYAHNVKTTVKHTLRPATPTEQVLGVIMVVGGVYTALYNRTIPGLLLAAGGSLLVTGKAQEIIAWTHKKANELVDCVKNDTKTVASR